MSSKLSSPPLPVEWVFRVRTEAGRHWDSAHLQWRVCAGLAVVLVVVAMGSLAWLRDARQGHARAEQVWLRTSQQAARQAAVDSASAPLRAGPPVDFTASLPLKADLPEVVEALQRACAAAAVHLQGMQAKEAQPASTRALGRNELGIQLRGPYAGVRHVMASLVQAQPDVTVSALRLRRGNAGVDEIEATATLSVWTRPVGLSGAGFNPSASPSAAPVGTGH